MPEKELTLEDLKGLTPIAQGRKIFDEKQKPLARRLSDLWSYGTPQYALFSELGSYLNVSVNYPILIKTSLYAAARVMRDYHSDLATNYAGAEKEDLMMRHFLDLLGERRSAKKEDIDKGKFLSAAFSEASRCYARIEAAGMPELKVSKIRFTGARKVDAADCLLDSLVAHQITCGAVQAFPDHRFADFPKNAEAMLSYIAEAFGVGIADIGKKTPLPLVPLATDGVITFVPLEDVLNQYEDV